MELTEIDPDDRAPSGWLRLGEVAWHMPRLLAGLGPLGPRGPEDGPSALVIPGFLASDRTTMELRRGLARGGWRTYPWELGLNKGARPDTLEQLGQRLDAVHDPRKVLLVGWSLGGLFARELARLHPAKVRAVVTLGSPFSGDLRTNTNVRRLYEWVAGHRVDEPPFPRITAKPPVPTLALWSRRDGIVSVRSARGLPEESDRSIEIESSHMGFAVSRPVLERIVTEIRHFLKDFEA
ncbi:MAG: alpha/beta fold hydrolase [Sphingomicrobium sp.]